MLMALTFLLACQDTAQEPAPKPKTQTETPKAQKTKQTDTKSSQSSSSAATDLDPKKATETAPDTYEVLFETTQGNIVLEIQRSWAPLGADRFYNLVKMGYFTDVAFFRAIQGFRYPD